MTNTIQNTSRGHRLWTAVRDELSRRRLAVAQTRGLRRDLATYTTPHQVDDLLAAFEGEEGPEFDTMRSILSSNLQRQQRTLPFAS
jgi:hypothetical protein